MTTGDDLLEPEDELCYDELLESYLPCVEVSDDESEDGLCYDQLNDIYYLCEGESFTDDDFFVDVGVLVEEKIEPIDTN